MSEMGRSGPSGHTVEDFERGDRVKYVGKIAGGDNPGYGVVVGFHPDLDKVKVRFDGERFVSSILPSRLEPSTDTQRRLFPATLTE